MVAMRKQPLRSNAGKRRMARSTPVRTTRAARVPTELLGVSPLRMKPSMREVTAMHSMTEASWGRERGTVSRVS